MRNAGLGEMLSAHLVKPIENVMYLVRNPWHGEVLAHYKHQYTFPNGKQGVMMESSEGYLMPCENKWLCAVLKKEGTPVKPKSAHVKGSKPWLAKFEYVDYDPKLIAPGVKVKCRDKRVRIVSSVAQETSGGYRIDFMGKDVSGVDLKSGLANYICLEPYPSDIMKILVEKQQTPAPLFSEDTDKMLLDAVLKALKNNSDDHCMGYEPNVWHFWQGKSNTPPVNLDTIVQICCRGNTADQAEHCLQLQAGYWWWKWDNTNSDINAFRIVE